MPVPSFAPEPPSEGISEGNATDVSRHLDGQPLHCAMFPFCFLSLADKVLVDVDINIKNIDPLEKYLLELGFSHFEFIFIVSSITMTRFLLCMTLGLDLKYFTVYFTSTAGMTCSCIKFS